MKSTKPPKPANELQRLAALREYRLLDTDPEEMFEDITKVAAHICKVPMAVISLVDENRQWFKARTGVRHQQTPRDVSFCAHTICQHDPLVVPDAMKDKRFAESPLVRKSPSIRFYAGFPLRNHEGYAFGSLCALDCKPHTLAPEQMQVMEALARQVIALMELKRISNLLADSLKHVRVLRGLLPICAWCKKIRDDDGYWTQVDSYLREHTDASFTHGICPDCLTRELTANEAQKFAESRSLAG